MKTIDIIIPVYNEESSIPSLFVQLQHFSDRKPSDIYDIKFIFINDGSNDKSASLITAEINSGLNASLINLTRNFGHQPAISAGLKYSSSDLVAIIDADLQDPPTLIWDMLKQLHEGYDIIYGIRSNRKDCFLKRIGCYLFYKLLNLLSSIEIPEQSGDFCLMKKSVVTALNKLPEHLKHHRVLRSWVGFKQKGFSYDRPKRDYGVSKYSFLQLYKLATDGLTSASTKPLQIAQFFIFINAIFSILLISTLFYQIYSNFFNSQDSIITILLFTNILISLTSLFSTVFIYILGAYISRIYQEVKGRPQYLVESQYQLNNDE